MGSVSMQTETAKTTHLRARLYGGEDGRGATGHLRGKERAREGQGRNPHTRHKNKEDGEARGDGDLQRSLAELRWCGRAEGEAVLSLLQGGGRDKGGEQNGRRTEEERHGRGLIREGRSRCRSDAHARKLLDRKDKEERREVGRFAGVPCSGRRLSTGEGGWSRGVDAPGATWPARIGGSLGERAAACESKLGGPGSVRANCAAPACSWSVRGTRGRQGK